MTARYLEGFEKKTDVALLTGCKLSCRIHLYHLNESMNIIGFIKGYVYNAKAN